MCFIITVKLFLIQFGQVGKPLITVKIQLRKLGICTIQNGKQILKKMKKVDTKCQKS